MIKFDWLLGGLSMGLLAAAAVASDKPQSTGLPTTRQLYQISEAAVPETEAPRHCPCCELSCGSMLPCGEAALWFVAGQWLKPMALGCQIMPFLGYVDEHECHDPHMIVAQFLRSVVANDNNFDIVLAATPPETCPKCNAGQCTAAQCAAGCSANCKCADGAKCLCPATAACTESSCGKCCATCTAKGCEACGKKSCACGTNCKCATKACACEDCPCTPSAPRGVWMRHPVPPPAFGMHWGVLPPPYGAPLPPPWAIAELPPPGPHGYVPHIMPHPMAWQGQPPYPRILPPVAEEQFDTYVDQGPVTPEAAQTPFQPTSRAVRRPTPPARPVSWSHGQVNVNNGQVRYVTPGFEATCERMSCHGSVVVLEGNVQLWLRPGAGHQVGCIRAQRVEVNAETGDFNVTGSTTNQVHNELPTGIVPSSYKPDCASAPTRPVQR